MTTTLFGRKTVTAEIVDFPAPVKTNWSKFDKLMDKRVKAVKASLSLEAANPLATWGITDHQREVWNQALDEAEQNVYIFYALYEQEYKRGNRVAAQLQYSKAEEWYEWGKKIESATPAEYWLHHCWELGLSV